MLPIAATACLVVILHAAAYGHDLVWPGEKLRILYPEAVYFEQKNLYVSD